MASASGIPSDSVLASTSVGSPRTVAGGVAKVGVVAPLGAVPGVTSVRVLARGAGGARAAGAGASSLSASIARPSAASHLSLLR